MKLFGWIPTSVEAVVDTDEEATCYDHLPRSCHLTETKEDGSNECKHVVDQKTSLAAESVNNRSKPIILQGNFCKHICFDGIFLSNLFYSVEYNKV